LTAFGLAREAIGVLCCCDSCSDSCSNSYSDSCFDSPRIALTALLLLVSTIARISFAFWALACANTLRWRRFSSLLLLLALFRALQAAFVAWGFRERAILIIFLQLAEMIELISFWGAGLLMSQKLR
jgi:hypothetical protein